MRLHNLLPLYGTFLLGVSLPSLDAQVVVTLSSAASPTSGQPGVTTINVTGSGFPSGTILPASTTVSLQPAAGGAATNTSATAVTTIAGTTRRVIFLIPASISVSSPTGYKVTLAGQTTTNTTFNTPTSFASLTINPGASISQVNPASGSVGQTLSVTITGNLTNFVQGSTQARFGPEIAVGGAAQGSFGPVIVTSSTSATASLVITGVANLGAVTVDVRTGVQQSSLPSGFSIAAVTLTGAKEYIYFNGKPLTVEQGAAK
jgi:hypothetical protein